MRSRTRNGADPRPLSLPDIYAISGESVLGARQKSARACAFPCRFHDTNRLMRPSAASVPGGGGLRLNEPHQAGP